QRTAVGRVLSSLFTTYKKSFLLLVTITYTVLVLFSLFNYKQHCIFTHPETLLHYDLLPHDKAYEYCQINWNNLGVRHVEMFRDLSEKELIDRYPFVREGGKWKPEKCRSVQKVAIIIPYRDRGHHLRLLLNRLHPMLRSQLIQYRIFVVEQGGKENFNRGKLMNVGFNEALNYENFDCFIFHDVDMLPENDQNLYICDENLRQLSSAIDEMRYHVMYYNYAGGVIAMKREVFRKINGYANTYWGWGNEDDDISARAMESGLLLTRPPEHIGRVKMVRHKKESRAEEGYGRFDGWRGRWLTDGLNNPRTLNYSVISKSNKPLYTHILVNVGLEKHNSIHPEQDTTKESTFW
ncbi:hypothetical protein FSP39_010088, partial [Pinctada imbricata]